PTTLYNELLDNYPDSLPRKRKYFAGNKYAPLRYETADLVAMYTAKPTLTIEEIRDQHEIDFGYTKDIESLKKRIYDKLKGTIFATQDLRQKHIIIFSLGQGKKLKEAFKVAKKSTIPNRMEAFLEKMFKDDAKTKAAECTTWSAKVLNAYYKNNPQQTLDG
ncbi:unnamed protein product, partial [marine sediment metagenome]